MTQPLEIDCATFAAWRAAGEPLALLDVREDWERQLVSLPGSLGIPMQQVPGRLAKLPADRRLVVLCHHGARSLRVVQFLRERSFAGAINLAGGIDAYSRTVDPGLPTY
jgi:rhodanese-related sulfurtransferase